MFNLSLSLYKRKSHSQFLHLYYDCGLEGTVRLLSTAWGNGGSGLRRPRPGQAVPLQAAQQHTNNNGLKFCFFFQKKHNVQVPEAHSSLPFYFIHTNTLFRHLKRNHRYDTRRQQSKKGCERVRTDEYWLVGAVASIYIKTRRNDNKHEWANTISFS